MSPVRFPCDNPTCRPARHWTRRAADACYAEAINSQTALVAGEGDYDWAAERERIYRQRMEAARLKRLAAKLADYTPEPPPGPQWAIANASGERQLRALRNHLHAVGSMSFRNAYKMNWQLRTGEPQELDDDAGFLCGAGSYDQLLDWAAQAFDALGDGVRLDAPLRALRGDTTATHDLLNRAVGEEFIDPGYVFATLSAATAQWHIGQGQHRIAQAHRPALVTLHLHSALYVPAPEQQSIELVEIGHAYDTFRSMGEQFIVPAGSRWRVDLLDTTGADGVVRAEVTQL